ncbi:MAG TPA: discoidin domain-containing protein [Labilithrix sp.]|nr:discoidin domain-containing protein [Labilithrix sp.]
MRKFRGLGALMVIGGILVSACGSDEGMDGGAPPPPPLGAGGEYLGPAQRSALTLWMAKRAAAAENNMCWRRSYGRGVGDVLSECPGLDRSGALCYPECKSGFKGVGPVCWERCRSGYTDDGAFCRKDPQIYAKDSYGRGAGYAVWDEDRCRDESDRGCEYYGAMWYPRCRSGYEAVECCICRERDCASGYVDDGAFCRKPGGIYAKESYGRGAGVPMTCPSTQPFDCGAACAKNEAWCAVGVMNMILAPIELATNIVAAVVSGGTVNAAKASLKSTLASAAKQAGKAAARTALRQSKTFSELATKLAGYVAKAIVKKYGPDIVQEVGEKAAENILIATLTDGDKEMLDIFADVDPTGVAAVIEAFYHPTCLSDDMPDLSLFADAKLPSNLAKKRPTSQSSTASGALPANAVDTETNGAVATTNSEANPWWKVDLGQEEWVGRIAIHRVAEAGSYPVLRVILTDSAGQFVTAKTVSGGDNARIEANFSAPGRYVTVQRVGTGALSLAEVEVHENELRDTYRQAGWVDLVRGSPTTQSSKLGSSGGAELAVDGDPATASVTREEDRPWWQVDLGSPERVENIVVDGDLTDFDVVVLDTTTRELARIPFTGTIAGPTEFKVAEKGRYIRVELRGRGVLKLRSVAANALRANFALAKDALQSSNASVATLASRAVDGDPATASMTAVVGVGLLTPSWEVDLGRARDITRVKLVETNGLADYQVSVLDETTACVSVANKRVCYPSKTVVQTVHVAGAAEPTELVRLIARGRYVRVTRRAGPLSFGEVQVF